jgi:hypothetical protein
LTELARRAWTAAAVAPRCCSGIEKPVGDGRALIVVAWSAELAGGLRAEVAEYGGVLDLD